MSWNNLPVWDKNRSIYFQLGMVISLGLANIIIEYTGTKPEYGAFVVTDDGTLNLQNVSIHRESVSTEKVEPIKKVDPLVAKIVETDEVIKPVETTEPVTEKPVATDSESTVGIESNIVEKVKVPIEPTEPPTLVMSEKMPFFTSCFDSKSEEEKRACTQAKMMDFIYKNLKYPSLARENGIEGTVIISFVVDHQGLIRDIIIVRDIGAGCANAAVKVINKLPKWEPGRHNDRPVNVKYNIPIKFKLT